MYSIREFSAFYPTSRWVPVKLSHFRVTCRLLRSRDVIFRHVTVSYCEVQPCRKWNVRYMPVFGILHPLPSDFQSNDVTFEWLPITWGHATSFPASWLSPNVSYSLVGSEMYLIRQFSVFYTHFHVFPGQWRHFRVTSSHLRSLDVISCHVTASYCELQPWRKWNVQYTTVFSLLHALKGDVRWNDVTSGSLPVTWGYVTSFLATWLPPRWATAL